MIDPVEALVLCRLLCERDSVGVAKVRAALEPLVRYKWTRAEWRERMQAAVDRLHASESIERSARGGVRLTERGRQQALAYLELPRLRHPASWRTVRNALAARAIGIPNAVASAEALRCAIVARAYGVELKRTLSEAALRNALTWKALGIDSDRPVTRAAIQSTLLGRLVSVGGEADGAGDVGVEPRRAIAVLAAKALGARRSRTEELKAASIRRLLDGTPASVGWGSDGLRIEAPGRASSASSIFAERILAIARAVNPEGRFGSNKVFISHIWRALERNGETDRAGFARRLIEANGQGHLRLSRADLVEAMDRKELAASEIAHENATFHFVRI